MCDYRNYITYLLLAEEGILCSRSFTARKWWSQNLNLGPLVPEPMLLPKEIEHFFKKTKIYCAYIMPMYYLI